MFGPQASSQTAPTTTTVPDTTPTCANPTNCNIYGSSAVDGEHIAAGVSFTGRLSGGGDPVDGGSSYLADCSWQEVKPDTPTFLHPIAGAWEVEVDELHWAVWCAPFTIAYAFFPAAEGPPVNVVQDMIRDAYYRTPVVRFDPQLSPPGDEDIPVLVQVKTFLWVDETLWDTPVQATASIPPISVTTTAQAYKAVWTGGDKPETLECDHGTPYRFGIGGDDANDDTCTMVFTKDSYARPDQQIDLSVHWAVTFTCTAYCGSGTLPDIITPSSREILVTEIPVVNS